MLSELRSLNLKLCSKQYNKKYVLHLIVAPQLCSGWQHNYSTKTRQAGRANEQSMYSLVSKLAPQSFALPLRSQLDQKSRSSEIQELKTFSKEMETDRSSSGKGDHFSMLGLSPQAQEKKVRQTIKP